MHGETFLIEHGIVASHHVEQNAIARCISACLCLFCPIARTETPSRVALGTFAFPFRQSAIFGIETHEVDTHVWRLQLNEARHFEHHSHSARTVISTVDWFAMILLIAVMVSPRTRIPMGADENALLLVAVVRRHDIARLDRSSVIQHEVGILAFDRSPETLKLSRNVVAALVVRLRIHRTRSELTLLRNIAVSAVGRKLRRRRLVRSGLHCWLTASATRREKCGSSHSCNKC